MSKVKFILLIPFFILNFNRVVWAQTVGNESTFFTSQMINIYFLMLLFATIINRFLEYVKLLLLLADRRIGLFQRLSTTLLAIVQRNMDNLGIHYDVQETRRRLNKVVLFTIMQCAAFGLGIVLAWVLHLNVFTELQIGIGQGFAITLTGLIIGAGVEPIHSFFRIAQEKRKLKKWLSRSGIYTQHSD